MRTPTALAVASIATLGLLLGCSNPGKRLEKNIRETLEEYTEVDGVSCPDSLPMGDGKTFQCTVTIGGEEFRIDAINEGERTNWTLDGAVIMFDQLEGLIENDSTISPPATGVDCGDGQRVLAVGAKTTCSAEGSRTFTVTTLDREGNVGWAETSGARQ